MSTVYCPRLDSSLISPILMSVAKGGFESLKVFSQKHQVKFGPSFAFVYLIGSSDANRVCRAPMGNNKICLRFKPCLVQSGVGKGSDPVPGIYLVKKALVVLTLHMFPNELVSIFRNEEGVAKVFGWFTGLSGFFRGAAEGV